MDAVFFFSHCVLFTPWPEFFFFPQTCRRAAYYYIKEAQSLFYIDFGYV